MSGKDYFVISHAHGLVADQASCPPLENILSILSMRWSVPALTVMSCGHIRFNALQRNLPGISHKVLTATLRTLQRDGFVQGPLTAELDAGRDVTQYRLSPAGRELLDLIRGIERWAQASEPQLVHARVEFERLAVRR
jgi:DNA-binding HxlR family transcriptional regulator